MATIPLPPDFLEFLRLLNSHRVEYLLIGGYAVGLHGYPRATADLDVWVAMDPHNAPEIPFIGLEDLIKNKRATGRAQDHADLDHLP